MQLKHYPTLDYVLIRKSERLRKTGDVELCIDYGQYRVEVWKVTPKRMGRCSVFIDRFALGLNGFYKMIGAVLKEVL